MSRQRRGQGADVVDHCGASATCCSPWPDLVPAGAPPDPWSQPAGHWEGSWAVLFSPAPPVSLQCAPENTLPTPMVLQR